MRTRLIKVSMEIPLPVDKPDENGLIYTKEALENAAKDAVDKPIEIIRDDGTSTIIGHTTKVDFTGEESYMVEGVVYYGGTEEIVELADERRIVNMEITGFGLSR